MGSESIEQETGIQAAKAGGFLAAGMEDAKMYAGTDFPLESFKELLLLCTESNLET